MRKLIHAAKLEKVLVVLLFSAFAGGLLRLGPASASPLPPSAVDVIFADGFDPEGILLAGPPDMLAIDAATDLPPSPARAGDIDDDVIMTRLDLYLDRSATVGQVNSALTQIQGGIVTMTPGRTEMTIAIPKPADQASLDAVRLTLGNSPGVLWAATAIAPTLNVLPSAPANDFANISYTYSARFPAAWNLSTLALAGCESRKVNVITYDFFDRAKSSSNSALQVEIPNFSMSTPFDDSGFDHGFQVTSVIAAQGDANPPTGANPFPQCLNVYGYSVSAISSVQRIKALTQLVGTDKIVSNLSWSTIRSPCGSNTCAAADLNGVGERLLSGAISAAHFRSALSAVQDIAVFTQSGGNAGGSPGALEYPYFGLAKLSNWTSMSSSARVFGSDPQSTSDDFTYLQDHSLLDPQLHSGLPSLVATDDAVARIRAYENQVAPPGGMTLVNNVLVTGSATNTSDPIQTQISSFANTQPDLFAVGEGVRALFKTESGASVSAPQVAGLVSYLWLLSDDLRQAPIQFTTSAILANVQVVNGIQLLDAYAAALSLDDAGPDIVPSPDSMPVRLALFDLNGDGKFDETDLATWVEHLILLEPNPSTQDWSRYDLNGDGYSGGLHTSRFDLDRRGSKRFDAAQYSSVQQTIEGSVVTFDENSVSDGDALCYYAYSPLYTGDTQMRTQLLADACSKGFTESKNIGGTGEVADALVSDNASTFALSCHPTPAETSEGFTRGVWVRRYDYSSHQWGDRTQLVPIGVDGQPDASCARIVSGTGSSGVIVVWTSIANSHTWLRRYDEVSGQWQTAFALDEDPVSYIFDDVGLDPFGNMLFTWVYKIDAQHWSPQMSYFDAGTGAISSPVAIDEGIFGSSTQASTKIFEPTDGNAVVVLYPNTLYRFSLAQKTLSTLPSRPIGQFPGEFGINGSGVLANAWCVSQTTQCWVSRLGTSPQASWSAPELVGTGYGIPLPSQFLEDIHGNMAIVASTTLAPQTNGQYNIIASYYDATQKTWTGFQRIDDTSLQLPNFIASIDPQRGTLVVGLEERYYLYSSAVDMKARIYKLGQGWGPAQTLALGARNNNGRPMVTSTQGSAMELWTEAPVLSQQQTEFWQEMK